MDIKHLMRWSAISAVVVAPLIAGCGRSNQTQTAPEPNIGPAALPGGGPAMAPPEGAPGGAQ